MATKYCGKDLLIQREDTPGSDTWTTVAHMRSTGVTLNNEQVDVTDKTDAPWRQLLANCGVQSMSISASGPFSNDASHNNVQQDAVDNDIVNYKVISGRGDEFEGAFQVASLERTGEYNADEQFSLTLESAGTITYTPAP